MEQSGGIKNEQTLNEQSLFKSQPTEKTKDTQTPVSTSQQVAQASLATSTTSSASTSTTLSPATVTIHVSGDTSPQTPVLATQADPYKDDALPHDVNSVIFSQIVKELMTGEKSIFTPDEALNLAAASPYFSEQDLSNAKETRNIWKLLLLTMTNDETIREKIRTLDSGNAKEILKEYLTLKDVQKPYIEHFKKKLRELLNKGVELEKQKTELENERNSHFTTRTIDKIKHSKAFSVVQSKLQKGPPSLGTPENPIERIKLYIILNNEQITMEINRIDNMTPPLALSMSDSNRIRDLFWFVNKVKPCEKILGFMGISIGHNLWG